MCVSPVSVVEHEPLGGGELDDVHDGMLRTGADALRAILALMNRTTTGIAVASLTTLLLTGCAQAPRATEPQATAEPLPAKCLDVTEGAIQKLKDDVTATIGEVTFTGHGAVRSEDVWYIALEFDEDGSPRTATWGTMQDPTVNDDVAFIAVDDMAPLVSSYKQPVAFQGVTSSDVGADDCIPG
jgi:hypothetical protein